MCTSLHVLSDLVQVNGTLGSLTEHKRRYGRMLLRPGVEELKVLEQSKRYTYAAYSLWKCDAVAGISVRFGRAQRNTTWMQV